MAQIDSTLFLGVPPNVSVEVHVPAGQGSFSNNSSDFPYGGRYAFAVQKGISQ